MIRVNEVDKSFGKNKKALDRLSIHVEKGSIYGLVGTNGAGKSTILRCITGILRPETGEILLDGQPVYDDPAVKQRIGYVSDDPFAFRGYSLREMAAYMAGFYPRWDEERFRRLVQEFSLEDADKLSSYSKGMRKQAALILALSAMPDVLVLDEPIDGLDPLVRRRVWKRIIDDVAAREMTVLVSSHNLREMEGYCDHIGIISQGRMIIERDLEDLKSDVHKVQAAFRQPGESAPALAKAGQAGQEDPSGSAAGSGPVPAKDAAKGDPVPAPDAAGDPVKTEGASAFDPAEAFRGLHVMHHEQRGSVHIAIVRDSAETIEKALAPYHPAVLDLLPLTLEEIFIYELGGDRDEIDSIIE